MNNNNNNNSGKRLKLTKAQKAAAKALAQDMEWAQRMRVANAPVRPKKARQQRQARKAQTSQAAPVAFSTMNTTKDPRIMYAPNGKCCRVQHRERIGTILGSTSFAVNAFEINPGLQATFPWLAAIAQRFEAYSFRSLRFEYRTKTATTALGDVILAIDYDAADDAPSTSVQAENYSESTSAAPWQDLDHNSRAVNLHKMAQYYVRTEALAANLDIKTYDVGNLFVCTENQASAALVGYLYVSYDVDLFTPQLGSDIAGQQQGGVVTAGGVLSAANPLGTVPVPDPQSQGFSVDGASLVTFSVPGTYLLLFSVSNATTLTAVSAAAVTNCSTFGAMSNFFNAGATVGAVAVSVVVSAANATLQLSVTAATVVAAKLFIARAPTGSLA